MIKSLEQLVCPIMDGKGNVRGTGFFIRPDGYVITCYHVVDACKGDIRVGIFGESESITSKVKIADKLYDIAVLKIKRENCQVLPLSTEWKLGDRIFSHGFSIQHSRGTFPKGFPMRDSVLTGTTTVRNKKTESELEVLVLDNTEVDFGLSGAPAFNAKTDNVIGILRWKYQEGEKALVTPVELLFEKWPDLKKYHELNQDLIIEDPKTQEILTIRSIQSVLRKGRTTEGDFFEKSEPEWIDFEEGYVVERREVNKIIKKLESEKIQLILGEPASGKSVILKNVGFKLASENENKKVYIVELKKHPKDEVKLYFKTIPKANDENAIFIVDDAHLYLSDCERLVRDFESIGKGKLIIGSRETKETTEEDDLKESSEFEYLTKTKIHAEDATDEIIKRFLKKRDVFSDERIKTVSEKLEEYKNDLWYLSWALKAYNLEKDSVEEKEIYVKMRNSIRKGIKLGKDEAGRNKYLSLEDVFLPLSVFYRFEIPVERKFLVRQLEIEKNKINQLIEHSEIIGTEEEGRDIMLSLNHSSIAGLYFEAYQRYPSLGEEVKEKILNQKDEKYLEYCLFYRYITTTDRRNAVDVMNHLSRDWNNKFGGETLLEKLINGNIIQKIIEEGIEKEEDIGKIGVFAQNFIQEERREVGRNLFYRMDIDALLSKIEDEGDIGKIGLFVRDIMVTENREVARRLVDGINCDRLLLKMEEEEDIRKIGTLVRDIVRTGRMIKARRLVDGINIDSLLLKIEEEEDLQKIGALVVDIDVASKEQARRLVDGINCDRLLLKMEEEEDIRKIGALVQDIVHIGRIDVAGKLVEGLNINALLSKIEKEEDIEKIGAFVRNIIWSKRKDVTREIVNRLNPKLKEELYKTVWWTTIKAGIS